MTIHYPLSTQAPASSCLPRLVPLVGPLGAPGSWRYGGTRRSRGLLAVAAVISAALHAALFFGVSRSETKVATAAEEVPIIRLTPMPELKDLEEPETVTSEEAPPPDNATLVPAQQDLPQLPQPSDFVQQVNFSTLLDKPDFSDMKIAVIPQNIRTGMNLAEKIGKIFNLEDLDRVPTPVLQPAPSYPHAMKREAIGATVMVEFIVDVEGRVLAPAVVDSTHHAFDEAAMGGVARWKFRPGIRGGKKVNTRMRVPIVFKTLDAEI